MYHFHHFQEYTTLWTKHVHRLGSHHHPGPHLLPPLSTAGAGGHGLARPHQEAATKRLCFPRWNTDNTDKCFTSELSVGRHHLSLPTPPHSALDSEGPKSRGS